MNERNGFPGLAQQFALGCGLCSFFHLTILTQGGLRYFPLVLLPYAPAVFAINRLFLRQSRTMRGVVLLNAALFTVLFASVLFFEGIADWATLVFQGGFCLWITIWGAYRCLSPPDLRSLIVSLDLSVLMLLLCTAIVAGAGLSVLWCAPTAVGCAASILGLVARRADRPPGPKEWGMLFLVFSGLSALMWLLVVLAAAPAGQGLVALWNVLTGAVWWLARRLWAILLFLLSLLPDVRPEETPFTDPVRMPSAEEIPTDETNPAVFMIFVAILAAAVIAALILGLRRLGRLWVGGRQVSAAARRQSGRISLWQALKRLWAALRTRLRLWVFLRRSRNTPEGLFHLLVGRCRLSPWHKRTGETPREFLTRLRETAVEDRELVGALDGLILAVDAALYAPFPGRQTYPAAKLIRRRFGAASRRYRFRRARERLRTALTCRHKPGKSP